MRACRAIPPSAGLDRLDWSVPDGTDGVIVELGANDMLRGLDPAVPRRAIEAIVERLKARGIPVMLAGMVASPNLGAITPGRSTGSIRRLRRSTTLCSIRFSWMGSRAKPTSISPTAFIRRPRGWR